MKKALVFFFAVVVGLSFALTGFAQDNTAASGPAKQGKQLTKGKYTQPKKKTQQASGAPAGGQPAQAETKTTPAAKVETPTATPAKVQATPAKVQATPANAGTQSTGPAKQGKQLTKGKFTQTKKKNAGGTPAGQ